MPESTLRQGKAPAFEGPGRERDIAVGGFDPRLHDGTSEDQMAGEPAMLGSKASRRTALSLILGAPLLGACSSVQQSISQFSVPNPFSSASAPGPAGPPQQSATLGNGQVRV